MSPRLAEENREAPIARLGLACGAGAISALLKPEPVDLGKGPTIERGAALIAMLFDEHEPERAADKAGASPAVAGEKVGETHEPGQHGNEPGPDRFVEIFRLHFSVPRRLGGAGTSGNTRANQEDSTFRPPS